MEKSVHTTRWPKLFQNYFFYFWWYHCNFSMKYFTLLKTWVLHTLTTIILEGISSLSMIILKHFSKYSFIYCLLYSFSTQEIIAKPKSVIRSFGFVFDDKLTKLNKFFWIWLKEKINRIFSVITCYIFCDR